MPPHSEEAERGLLGSILLNPTEVLDQCIEEKLYDEAFFAPSHRLLYQTISEMLGAGEVVDSLTLTDYMRRRGTLERVGGSLALDRLIDETPTYQNAPHYIAIVKRDWLRRKIIKLSREAERRAYEIEDPELLRSKVEIAFSDMHTPIQQVTIGDVWGEIVTDVEAGNEGRPSEIGMQTGYRGIDKATPGGMRKSHIYWLTGEQKSGKTRLKRNIIAWQLNAGRKIATLALEGDKREELTGLAEIALDRSLMTVILGEQTIEPHEVKKAENLLVNSGRLLVGDSKDAVSTTEVRSWCRRQVKKHGAEMIVIDYLQRMRVTDGAKKSIEQLTSEKVECLEDICHELKVPLLCLAAISAEGKVRGSRYADYTGAAHWQLSKDEENRGGAPDYWTPLALWVKESRFSVSGGTIRLRMRGSTGMIEAGEVRDGKRPEEEDIPDWARGAELDLT